MKHESRIAFSRRQREWFLHRDKHCCCAPFPHHCDTTSALQVHHIKPHGYLKVVAPSVSADFPENAVTLCKTAHEMIHPDVVIARNNYHLDNEVFYKLRDQRDALLADHKIYWVDTWDRAMEVVALVNTKRFIGKHPFPVYTHRKKHEKIEEPED